MVTPTPHRSNPPSGAATPGATSTSVPERLLHPGLPISEALRLETLDRYGLLDTPAVASFDRITKLAARCLVAPMAFIAWVDRDAIRLASRQGLEITTLPRNLGGSNPLLADGVRWYEDLDDSPGERDPSLTELSIGHGVRFLATAPLSTYNGQLLGALCVADVEPRQDDPRRRRELEELAGSLMKQIEARRLYHRLGRRAALREARHAQQSRCATPARKTTEKPPRLATDRQALLRRIGRRLESARHRPRQLERSAALMVFDLRGFGELNARLGYAAGDRVLTEIGRRLLTVKGRRDTAIHLGGDAFGLLMVDLDSPDSAVRRRQDFETLLSSPLQVGDVTWQPSADLVVVAVDPGKHRFADDVLAEAEAVLRKPRPELAPAAEASSAATPSEPAQTFESADPRESTAAAMRVLANEELDLRYRPLFDPPSGRIRGFEARLRWWPPSETRSRSSAPSPPPDSSAVMDPSSHAH